VSTRWRTAYLTTRQRSIRARENTPEQRAAARSALRSEVLDLQLEGVRDILQGSFKTGSKKFARSLLLGSVYVGVGVRVPSAPGP